MYERVELRELAHTTDTSSPRAPQHGARSAPTAFGGILKKLSKAQCQALRRHAGAALALLVFGLLPGIIYFSVVKEPFKFEVDLCGEYFLLTDIGPVYPARYDSGVEGLFTIDRTSGNFPFWLAKFLDTVWDLIIGRGLQLLFGLISYAVLSNALLRALEASPIPYRTFTSLILNGASTWTIIYILRDLHRYGRRRTVWLFAYSAVALAYVLAMPTMFSTMTGYVPITASFIEIPETSQLIPLEKFTFGVYYGLPSGKNSMCFPPTIVDALDTKSLSQLSTCTYFSNETYDGVSRSLRNMADPNDLYRQMDNPDNIKYNCTGKPSHKPSIYALINILSSDVINMTIDGMNYTYIDVWENIRDAYCFNNKPYDADILVSNSRCLPKATHRGGRAGYQWGFSAMLTSTVLILHAVWAASLYAVWLDAELGSTLVKQGFRLTQLRGAYFAVAAMKSSSSSSSSSSAANMPDDRVKGRGTISPPPPPSQFQSPSPSQCPSSEALTTAAEEQGSCAEGREEGEEEEEEQPGIGRRVRAADMEAMMEREDAMVRFELFEEELPFAGVVAYNGA
ncbi:hypothetical protein SLS58_000972 [Diplodia intermedia]|uniref:Uncharacterized protein n=1 Tax=Diplodia intermedia TaxID=856260 RepID=A0ABR3U3J9_9PEZI